MRYRRLFAASVFLAAASVTGSALTTEWGKYQVEDQRSGYTYAHPETRAIQDDDFENPGYFWVEQGEEMWSTPDGEKGISCRSCHGNASESMPTAGATYPAYAVELGKLINIEQRINQCRTERMGAEAWQWESDELLAMTAYVRNQARDLPVSPKIDGPAKPFYEAGKVFYEQRRGQIDTACMHCHAIYPGRKLRATTLSQGQSNGFPAYRLMWEKIGSLHRRFRVCNRMVRAEPYPYGADEYVNLELYLAWHGRGLPVETPAVRQ